MTEINGRPLFTFSRFSTLWAQHNMMAQKRVDRCRLSRCRERPESARLRHSLWLRRGSAHHHCCCSTGGANAALGLRLTQRKGSGFYLESQIELTLLSSSLRASRPALISCRYGRTSPEQRVACRAHESQNRCRSQKPTRRCSAGARSRNRGACSLRSPRMLTSISSSASRLCGTLAWRVVPREQLAPGSIE